MFSPFSARNFKTVASFLFLASLTALSAGCPEPPCTSGLPRYMGACPIRCDNDPTRQCYPDGGVIPDAPLLDAGDFDVPVVDSPPEADTADAADITDVPPADVIVCDAGTAFCNDTCIPVTSDPQNCGACRHACSAPSNASPACSDGVCGFTCASAFHACGAVCAADDSPLSCGMSCNPCPAPAGATASCTAGTCGWSCNPGYQQVGGTCEVAVPRQLAPLSTAFVTSQRPTFRWELAAGADGAVIEVCRDRAFTAMCQTANVVGTSGTITTPLQHGVWFWRLRGLTGGSPGTRAGSIWEFVVGARSATVDSSAGTMLDANGDGFADLAVGATSEMTQAGAVHVFYGGSSGLPMMPSQTLAGIDGTYGSFGAAIASAGDVNGDGYADLIAAATGTSGRLHLYLGGPTGFGTLPSWSVSPAGMPYGMNLTSVAAAGDVNGDGYADVIVGVGNALSRSRADVYYGSASGLPMAPSTSLTVVSAATIRFGSTVASAGDVDGDQFADVLVGAPAANSNAGTVYLFRGSATGISSSSSWSVDGPDGANSQFGASIFGAGDVNGDGYWDAVVGAPGAMFGVGTAYVFHGGASGLGSTAARTITGPDGSSGYFGHAVSGFGDLNGDGFADIAVVTTTSRVHLFAGGASGVNGTAFWSVSGPDGATSSFGDGLATSLDINGDGIAEVIAGAWRAATASGRVYSFLGATTGPTRTPTQTLSSPATGGAFGASIAK